MVKLKARIEKFGKQGEKTGWQYILIPQKVANKINKGIKTSYRIKGRIDDLPIAQKAILPIGDGDFILPVNGEMRKKLRKGAGHEVMLCARLDESNFVFNPHLIACLADEPDARAFFESMPGSHQRYFSKWIDSAKTEATMVKRIAQALKALQQKQRYNEMMRDLKRSRTI